MNYSGVINRHGNAMFNMPHKIEDANGNQYTLPSGTKKVKVALHPDASNYFNNTSGSCKFNIYIYADSSHNVLLTNLTCNGKIASGDIPSSSEQEVDLTSLAGLPLNIRYTVTNGSGATQVGKIPITFKTNTPVTQGAKIKKEDINQTGTSIAAGTVMTNSKFSRGTKCEASTFNSRVLDA